MPKDHLSKWDRFTIKHGDKVSCIIVGIMLICAIIGGLTYEEEEPVIHCINCEVCK